MWNLFLSKVTPHTLWLQQWKCRVLFFGFVGFVWGFFCCLVLLGVFLVALFFGGGVVLLFFFFFSLRKCGNSFLCYKLHTGPNSAGRIYLKDPLCLRRVNFNIHHNWKDIVIHKNLQKYLVLPCRKKEITAKSHGPKGGYFRCSSAGGRDYSSLGLWASPACSLPFPAGLTLFCISSLQPMLSVTFSAISEKWHIQLHGWIPLLLT